MTGALGGSWDPLGGLTEGQVTALQRYADLLLERNVGVNLVSRSLGRDEVWRHIEHCLALRMRGFPEGARIVDWGSGGGLPAIPLAISVPHVKVTAIDATQKKVNAIAQMASELGLTNVEAVHTRAEEWRRPTDYSVSRATAPLVKLWRWHVRAHQQPHRGTAGVVAASEVTTNVWSPGLIAFKGGDLEEEIAALRKRRPPSAHELIELTPLLGPGYAGKVLISVVAKSV